MTQNDLAPIAFHTLQDQIPPLSHRGPVAVRAGHADLGEALWMSCDPAGQATMRCAPEEEGFRISLSEARSGAWACIGMRLPRETLAQGRYLGLLIEAEAEAETSFAPVLRYYFHDSEMQDVGAARPIVIPVGKSQHLTHIPLDPELLFRSSGHELNLFFERDQAEMRVRRLEPLLIA